MSETPFEIEIGDGTLHGHYGGTGRPRAAPPRRPGPPRLPGGLRGRARRPLHDDPLHAARDAARRPSAAPTRSSRTWPTRSPCSTPSGSRRPGRSGTRGAATSRSTSPSRTRSASTASSASTRSARRATSSRSSRRTLLAQLLRRGARRASRRSRRASEAGEATEEELLEQLEHPLAVLLRRSGERGAAVPGRAHRRRVRAETFASIKEHFEDGTLRKGLRRGRGCRRCSPTAIQDPLPLRGVGRRPRS